MSFRNYPLKRLQKLTRKLCKLEGLPAACGRPSEIFILALSRASLKQDLKRPTSVVALTGLRPSRRPIAHGNREGVTISLLAHRDLSRSTRQSVGSIVQE
ncbi:hypothetical protein X777_10451 [Ooceraea biroi]|uniref:Uncharacterized protein n=1 Tax=Ooceraea biroi TaxID=2015173 RepID=A0A026W480_OOCBI|nr:hypothetical protein X777_10451 [Ooceraea biroi]